jgi:hypothetical protein
MKLFSFTWLFLVTGFLAGIDLLFRGALAGRA